MMISKSPVRRKLHTRTIVCEGFEREDGLIDVEAHVVDTKTYVIHNAWYGDRPCGTPVHDMGLRLTVDREKVVQDIEVWTAAAPTPDCFRVAPAFKRLIGASLADGWRRAVNEAVGGTLGCTHLKELLGPAATVAIQTMAPGMEAVQEASRLGVKPHFLDACKGWSAAGGAVRELLPVFFTPQRKSE